METTTVVAPRTCSRCKVRKKKCDKMLPSCGRCNRLSKECSYDELWKDPEDGRAGDQNIELRERLAALETMVSDLSQEVKYLRSKPNSSTDDSSPQSQRQQVVSNPDHVIQKIMDHTTTAMEYGNVNVLGVFETYFDTIHNRLPILSKQKLLMDLQAMETPNDELELIKGVISLLVIYPDNLASQSTSFPLWQLYEASKSLFCLITSVQSPQLRSVQAGILICYYEITQGWLKEAQNSLRICTRSAQLVQQLEELSPSPYDAHSQHQFDFEIEPIFWSLSLLQSYLYNMSCDVLAQNPTMSRLQSEEFYLAKKENNVSFPIQYSSGGLLQPYHVLEKTAASLLDDVSSIVYPQDEFRSSQFRQALELDYKITGLIIEIKGQPEHPLVDQTVGGEYVICLWALYKLHCSLYQKAVELNDHNFSELSKLSLRQLFSVSETLFQALISGIIKREVDIRILPPALCCVLHYNLIAMELLSDRAHESLDGPVRYLLHLLCQKWSLAEMSRFQPQARLTPRNGQRQ
ncbi:hypothetical protein TSTA_066620 [Talaromyces stipitatus ATCC 10500]|uniref:Zn(2)-C6 fungal-type domain-containing protein n=1 Tax=Talaromyces stipitatus (strain ATCC 10500 / CBS 375.48 / QM 6759 / NRRL 1006) TaxID=441959 RepID=B8LXD5_TALSN|nr:uncharacterized protein TSTA_066620 [Talaromyces stipitatus ATCC 10500]EED23216.1 hypothetical protein TSTA_066620 [Talaromyces stipitatus ATCC 10500]